jgi:hypothetical protein
MSARVRYLREYYRENGLVAAAARVAKFALGVIKARQYRRFAAGLQGRESAAVFAEIYAKGLWKGGLSHSGLGSEMAYTENLRFYLPILFDRFGIRKIVDAACGDFNWMRLVPLTSDMSYLGIDIVPRVIAHNQRRYADARHRFQVANIVADPLPTADLLICRDCLFHLSNHDVVLVLRNFVASNSRYLLTSSHVNEGGFTNLDISTGHFRLIDLFSPPFCLPRQVHYHIDDYVAPFPPRAMYLWDRTQVGGALRQLSGES